MKKTIPIILSILLTLTIGTVSCSARVKEKGSPILSRLLYQEDVRVFKLPGFLVRYAMLATEETRRVRPALRGITSVTISLSEDIRNSREVFSRINSKLVKANYSNFMEIIDNDSRISIKALEKNGRIREMVIIIDDSSSFICLGIKGNINPENFIQLVSNLTEDRKKINV